MFISAKTVQTRLGLGLLRTPEKHRNFDYQPNNNPQGWKHQEGSINMGYRKLCLTF